MTGSIGGAAARAAARVIRWTEFYTAGLPAEIRSERLDEVRSDLHEQVVSGSAVGELDRAVARSIRARSIRGKLADVSWRRTEVRRLPGRGATIATRVVLALVIAATAVPSTVLLAGSHADSSNSALARVQVGSLKDQVRGETLFLLPLDSRLIKDLHDLGSDPIYSGYLGQQNQGALEEYNNLRVLLVQLASEQRRAALANEAASQTSTESAWLTGFTAAAFVLFAFALWFEPRLPRGSDATRGTNAKS